MESEVTLLLCPNLSRVRGGEEGMERKDPQLGDGCGRDTCKSDSDFIWNGAGLLQLEGGGRFVAGARLRGEEEGSIGDLAWPGELGKDCDRAGADWEGRIVEVSRVTGFSGDKKA